MSIEKAVIVGLEGNEISKKITGTNEVSVGRSAVATGSGAALGAAAGGALAVGTSVATGTTLAAAAVATAPVTVPLAVAAGAVSLIASLFD